MRDKVFEGKDPRVEFKRLQIQSENQSERQVYTQLSDGSVPSYEKFEAIKMQLMDKSKSPLTKAEKKQETLRQYLELQSMASEKSLHRVKALQGKLN